MPTSRRQCRCTLKELIAKYPILIGEEDLKTYGDYPARIVLNHVEIRDERGYFVILRAVIDNGRNKL